MAGPAFLRQPSRIHEPAPPPRRIHCLPYGQLTRDGTWRMSLLHDRGEDLLLWVTRGQGRVVIDGTRRGLGANNAVFLPAGTLLACELGPQAFAQAILSPPGLTERLPRKTLHLRPRDSFAQAEFTGEIEAMQREISRDRPLVQEALAAHLQLVAVWLDRQSGESAADAPREAAADRLVRRYAGLLVTHFRSERMMADYAEMLDVTPTHLSRVCRAACGRTAAEMLTERVLHEARRLLSEPEPPIQDIARGLGFSSATYFTRFIQNHTGVSPSLLRARSLGKAPPPAPTMRRT